MRVVSLFSVVVTVLKLNHAELTGTMGILHAVANSPINLGKEGASILLQQFL